MITLNFPAEEKKKELKTTWEEGNQCTTINV